MDQVLTQGKTSCSGGDWARVAGKDKYTLQCVEPPITTAINLIKNNNAMKRMCTF